MSAITTLQAVGLSDKEARVYLAALELGRASVQDIAKKSSVNRATTYVILESLMKQGLCSTYDEGKKTFYIASNPETLRSLFALQQKEIEERQRQLESVMDDLRLITNKNSDKPIIKFFDGKQGILNATEEYRNSYRAGDTEPARMIYPRDRVNEIISSEEKDVVHRERLKKHIKSKVICTSSTPVETTPDGDRTRVNAKKFPVSSDISIYGDYVVINSLGKRLSAVLIKDREIANTLKSLFDLAWEGAQKHKE